MFCNFNCSTKAGNGYNEDSVFYDGKLLIVMDAATSLDNLHLTPAVSDGCWFSENTVSMLSRLLADSAVSIKDSLRTTASVLKKQLDAYGYNNDAEAYPSGSVMIARIQGSTVELFTVGDCTAVIAFNDARPEKVIHDDSVTKLDNAVIAALLHKQRKSGKSIIELLPEVNSLLLANRKLRNSTNGYWIFDPVGMGIEHGTSLTFNSSEIKAIALMSDGFARISSMKKTHEGAVLDLLKNTPADVLTDDLFELLDRDSHFNKYPRFKARDDTSVIYAEIGK